MDVSEIINRYSAGERIFQRVNLQEADLTGLNLVDIDLSYPLGSRSGRSRFRSCYYAGSRFN